MGNRKTREQRSAIYTILPFLSVALIILAWTVFSTLANNNLFPTIPQVWARLVKTFTTPIAKANLFGHIWASLKRVIIALLFAWTLGIFFGVIIARNKYCNAIFGKIFEIFRPIPPIAWIPVIIMWFGIGEFPKVILVFIGTFFPVMINTQAGISLVDPINMDVGKIFGANSGQMLKDIIIPTALPSIFAGIRTSVSSGWTVVLAAEMMGAQQGLGALVMKGWNATDMALVLVSVITIAAIGALLAFVLNKAERLVTPWNR